MPSTINRRTVLGLACAAAGQFAIAGPEKEGSHRVRELLELTGGDALRHMREGALTAETYTKALLSRHEAAAQANALTWFDADKVLEQARRVDRLRAGGTAKGMLSGLPVVIKDNIDTVGFPTSAGTRVLQDNFPRTDAPVAHALFEQGAILLGKTNMHELAGGGTSNNPVFGAVHNPYDPSRIAGGSSGGTAAAVALRFAPAGLGTDTAGSVRIPSALCGIAGLRPSTAGASKLYADDGIVPLALDLDTAGPMARSVADLALLNAAITKSAPPAPSAARGLRIGLPNLVYWSTLDPAVESVMQQALRRLGEAGVVFVHVDISSYIYAAQQAFGTMIMTGVQKDLDTYFHQHGSEHTRAEVVAQIASRDTRSLFDIATRFTPPPGGMKVIRETLGRLLREYERVLERAGVEALCFPTEPLPAPPIRLGGDGPNDTVDLGGVQTSEPTALVRNTRPVCALGAPGLTLPAGLTANGLPVGLEFEGKAGSDVRLLALGMCFESILGRLPSPI